LTKQYTSYPSLSDVYLEDSYVLDIVERPSEIRFALEAVLTPDSPLYHEPLPGEQYCYVRGNLIFRGVTNTEWVVRSFQKYTDSDGEQDLGNIDSLTNENDIYMAEGDWGKVRIHTVQDPGFELTSG
jgi:hypothetical protein